DHERAGTVEQRAGSVTANGPDEPAARYEPDSGAGELDRRHQGQRPDRRPQQSGTERCPGDRISGDAARVVVRGSGNQPGTEGSEKTMPSLRALGPARGGARGPARPSGPVHGHGPAGSGSGRDDHSPTIWTWSLRSRGPSNSATMTLWN